MKKTRSFRQSFALAKCWERAPPPVTATATRNGKIFWDCSSREFILLCTCLLGNILAKKVSLSQKAQPELSKHIWQQFSAHSDIATSGSDFQVGQQKKRSVRTVQELREYIYYQQQGSQHLEKLYSWAGACALSEPSVFRAVWFLATRWPPETTWKLHKQKQLLFPLTLMAQTLPNLKRKPALIKKCLITRALMGKD